MDVSLEQALSLTTESAQTEFKDNFELASAGEWCEILKDIIAIANSGGGILIFGLDSHGVPTDSPVSHLVRLDPAEITNKVFRYTGYQFDGFRVVECFKGGKQLAAITIDKVDIPIVFSKPGTYDVGEGKQRTAFSSGSLYFRHGAKSEPGNTEDIRMAFERRLADVRESWLGNIRQVFEAPIGSTLIAVNPNAPGPALPIRLTDDPGAPVFAEINPDMTHPFRQKELIESVNKMLPPEARINQYDIQCLRKLYGLDQNATYHHLPKFGSHQYSQALADWLVKQCRADPEFFSKARRAVHDARTRTHD